MHSGYHILQFRIRRDESVWSHPHLRTYLAQGWRVAETHAVYGRDEDVYLTVWIEREDDGVDTGLFSQLGVRVEPSC